MTMNKMLIGLTGLTLALSACGSSSSDQAPTAQTPAAQTASTAAVQTQALVNTYSGTLGLQPDTQPPSFVTLPSETGFSYSGGTLKATLTSLDGYASIFLLKKTSYPSGTVWNVVDADPYYYSHQVLNKVITLEYPATKGEYKWSVFNKFAGDGYYAATAKYTLVTER